MSSSNLCLITGASGFVGSALLARCRSEGRAVLGTSRNPPTRSGLREAPPLSADSDWLPLLEGVDSIVHSAARVHVMNDTSADPTAAFRLVNVEGTLALACQAARAGVRRFVFLSSIKVNGEATAPGRPFRPEDVPAPTDPYGVSKLEAEQALLRLSGEMEVVIVRPPLVYGPGVRANFEAMMRWLLRGVPLPLGAIENRRTLVALDNLVDLLLTCVDHPHAAGQVFLAGDAEDLSTPDLLRRLAAALGVRAMLLPVPAPLLETGAALLGKRSIAQRLCSNLQLDTSKARELLGWRPPVGVDEALRRTAVAYLERRA